MKNKIIIGNWKMNPISSREAEKLFKDILKSIPNIKKTKIIICPPFVYLEKLKSTNNRIKKISFGAQNLFVGNIGPFTGEISAGMLENIGVKYVILGHSERRNLGENNLDINKKLKSALSVGITPILCIGESIRDENHEYFNFIKKQIEECLNGISKNQIEDIIIAYEPIWSISTTINHHNANEEDINEIVVFIRKIVSNIYSFSITQNITIIYGGSVNKKNISDIINNTGVGGVLVGGASLNVKEFSEIIKITENAKY